MRWRAAASAERTSWGEVGGGFRSDQLLIQIGCLAGAEECGEIVNQDEAVAQLGDTSHIVCIRDRMARIFDVRFRDFGEPLNTIHPDSDPTVAELGNDEMLRRM